MPPPPERDDRLALASLDALGDSDRLRAEAELRLRAAGGDTRAPAHQQGADTSDSIWVSIDASGRVEGIDISRNWRDRLGAGGFAVALFEAYTDAVRKASEAIALAALASDRERGVRQGSGDTHVPAAAARHQPEPPADERRWLADTWRELHDIDAELSRIERIAADGSTREAEENTVTGPHGYLTVRLRGLSIAGITGDARRINAASTEQLRLEALAAFRAVQRGGDG